MWKTLALVSTVVCISLLVWSLQLRRQLAIEHQLVDTLTDGKAHAEAQAKRELARYDLLHSSCRSLGGEIPGVGVCTTVVPSSSQANSQLPFPYRIQRTPDIPVVLVGEGMRWNLLSSLALNDEERVKMSRLLSAEQKQFLAAMEESPARTLDMSVAQAVRVETDRQIYAVLGEDRYREFADYREFPQEHSRISQLNMRLTEAGQPPLSGRARIGLLSALREEVQPELAPNTSQFSSRSDYAAAYETWRKGYEQRVRNRAISFLTPEQLILFDGQRRP